MKLIYFNFNFIGHLTSTAIIWINPMPSKEGLRIHCQNVINKTNIDEGNSSVTRIHTYIHTYIYIYIYANFIKHNRHFMSIYFLLDPFEFPYYFYCILGELIYVLSIVACIPSTFCPTLGHHQGRIYYKSDVTFVLAYYNCVRASLPLKVLTFVFECDSIFSASS